MVSRHLASHATHCSLIITLNIYIPRHPAYYSTTTTHPILNLTPGGFWARRQLHAGIGYIPIALILMEIAHPSDSGLLSLLILNSMADSSTTAESILDPSLGRRWARR